VSRLTARRLLNLFNEVGDNLCVGLGDKLVALGDEFALQFQVILHNAVMDHDDAARAIPMGVGVLFGGPPVGSPAGVADAEGAIDGMFAQDLFQIDQLARSAAHLKGGAVGTAHGDARRVVAAVFQPPQPFDDDRNHLLWTDITDNSAHNKILNDDAGGRMRRR